jgi:transglutaminase-like putative cysteine protease
MAASSNHQQDPYGNWLARYVFPELVRELKIEVDVVADMTVYNPFDFFVEESAEIWPFEYGEDLRPDLIIYRTGFGRTIMMDFQNFEHTITERGKNRIMKAPMVWNWIKISSRELLWEELPF